MLRQAAAHCHSKAATATERAQQKATEVVVVLLAITTVFTTSESAHTGENADAATTSQKLEQTVERNARFRAMVALEHARHGLLSFCTTATTPAVNASNGGKARLAERTRVLRLGPG